MPVSTEYEYTDKQTSSSPSICGLKIGTTDGWDGFDGDSLLSATHPLSHQVLCASLPEKLRLDYGG